MSIDLNNNANHSPLRSLHSSVCYLKNQSQTPILIRSQYNKNTAHKPFQSMLESSNIKPLWYKANIQNSLNKIKDSVMKNNKFGLRTKRLSANFNKTSRVQNDTMNISAHKNKDQSHLLHWNHSKWYKSSNVYLNSNLRLKPFHTKSPALTRYTSNLMNFV